MVDSPWTWHDPRGIIEIYETTTGWAYKWITPTGSMNTYTGLGYPGTDPGTPYLQQTNNGIRASISLDGTVMAVIWLDAATLAPADSMPDIWFSWRHVAGNAWSTPVNLTQTPGYPELLLHAAPTLKHNGGNSYTMFIGRSYQSSVNTYPPDNITRTTFYIAAHTFDAVTDVEETGGLPSAYRLDQNYPNPFNPSTTISYHLPASSWVTLTIHDILGQRVATVVDGPKAAGEHTTSFNADNLPSGVYYFTTCSKLMALPA